MTIVPDNIFCILIYGQTNYFVQISQLQIVGKLYYFIFLIFFISQISKEWLLGPELCDMWTSSDVLCCTASILHLVAIALDR